MGEKDIQDARVKGKLLQINLTMKLPPKMCVLFNVNENTIHSRDNLKYIALIWVYVLHF